MNRDRLKKLLALATQGVGGEADNARRVLNRLLDRYGMTEDDLADQPRQLYWFRYDDAPGRRLLQQLVYSFFPKDDPRHNQHYTSRAKQRQLGVKLTEQEHQEFAASYVVYRAALKQHMERAYSAFIQANEIFPEDTDVQREYTDEEIAEMRKVLAMAKATERTTIHKQLEEK